VFSIAWPAQALKVGLQYGRAQDRRRFDPNTFSIDIFSRSGQEWCRKFRAAIISAWTVGSASHRYFLKHSKMATTPDRRQLDGGTAGSLRVVLFVTCRNAMAFINADPELVQQRPGCHDV
jgi:hypothetical protein